MPSSPSVTAFAPRAARSSGSAYAQYEEYDGQMRTLAGTSDSDFDQAVKRITDAEADKPTPPRRRRKTRKGDEAEAAE